MADPSPKSEFSGLTIETVVSVTKSILLLIGFISTVSLFKVAIIPKVASLVITTLSSLWVSFRLCLSPPYVFLVFNFIIFAVVASSALRRQKDTSDEDQNFSMAARSRQIWTGIPNEDEQGKEVEEGKPVEWDFPTLFTDKFSNPSSEKFCAYSSEKVEKDEDVGGGDGDGESMDAMWKTIMESQGKQTPQMKKSQTWDSPPLPRLIRAANADAVANPVELAQNEVKKSDRFLQTLSLRRKISMTSEELKSRAEAFIEMVNRSIRLQRQESEQRFLQALRRNF